MRSQLILHVKINLLLMRSITQPVKTLCASSLALEALCKVWENSHDITAVPQFGVTDN